MEEWINRVLDSGQAGIAFLAAVFLMGIISVVSCGCNFATIGVVAGYTGTIGSTGKTKAVIWSGVFFLIGTIVSMAVIGGIIGYAGELISDSFGNYWKIAAGLISIFFGLYTMNLLPFKMPAVSVNPNNQKGGIFSAIIFGFTIGGLSSACGLCCNPFFPVVLAVSFVKGSVVWGILMLLTFSLGYGLPLAAAMVGVGMGFGKISKAVNRFGTIMKYAGGIALIAIGFYLLITV
ncbi:MAG: cytochrome c biogenesis protein CcdA [Bacteroidales bacterium]